MYIGEVGIEEPMWLYLSFMRRAQREQWFIEHPIGVREITGLTLTSPVPLRSPVAQRIVESGFQITAKCENLGLHISYLHSISNSLRLQT